MAVSLKQQQMVLELLRDSVSLTKACKAADISSTSRWFDAMEANQTLADDYARARQEGHLLMADRIRLMAADPNIDPQTKRIMVDTDKWLLSKCLPKIYGDRIQVETKASPADALTDEELAAIIAKK